MNSTTPIALVTGGSRGIGRDTALKLATQGSDLILTYHSQRRDAEAVAAEVRQSGRRAVALQLDVGDSSGFAAFAARVAQSLKEDFQAERFHFLVNNAGSGFYSPYAEATEAQFDQALNIHFKSVFFLTQKLLPLLADGGAIVNISSGLARFSHPGSSVYASMKGAVEVLSRYMARELGPRRIRVNVVAPGAVATDFGHGRLRNDPQLQQQLAAVTALGSTAVAADIGGVIASLARPENGWVNGQRIEAAGGVFL